MTDAMPRSRTTGGRGRRSRCSRPTGHRGRRPRRGAGPGSATGVRTVITSRREVAWMATRRERPWCSRGMTIATAGSGDSTATTSDRDGCSLARVAVRAAEREVVGRLLPRGRPDGEVGGPVDGVAAQTAVLPVAMRSPSWYPGTGVWSWHSLARIGRSLGKLSTSMMEGRGVGRTVHRFGQLERNGWVRGPGRPDRSPFRSNCEETVVALAGGGRVLRRTVDINRLTGMPKTTTILTSGGYVSHPDCRSSSVPSSPRRRAVRGTGRPDRLSRHRGR